MKRKRYPHRKPSLRDVSEACGVNIMTASRALSGGYVSAATREKVYQTAKAMGYCCHGCRKVKTLPILIIENRTLLKFCSRACLKRFL